MQPDGWTFRDRNDDLYALDASRRARESVAYRKAKGTSIGIPLFGTVRNDEGLLVASPYGAWLLPDESFQAGREGEEPRHPNALWRGYHECTRLILELYSKNLHGYDWIAQELNREGWAFRDRWNEPRPLKLDDVRRVTSAWCEYAGLVMKGKASQSIACKIESPSSVLYDTGRAVFDLDLLQAVAAVQESRSVMRRPEGMIHVAHVFPLSDLLYCARCETEAKATGKGNARSRIIGHQRKKDAMRYRHSERRNCHSRNKSVLAETLEEDFRHLVDTLRVHPEAISLMAELAIESQLGALEQIQMMRNLKRKRKLQLPDIGVL